MGRDRGLDYLLDLNGHILVQKAGYWVKIEARKLERKTEKYPHGIKYSISLHDHNGLRQLGFDNAHPIRSRKVGRFHGRKYAYDHKHLSGSDKGTPYNFESAGQLLVDFFKEADRILNRITE